MKKTLLLAYTALLFVYLLPLLFPRESSAPGAVKSPEETREAGTLNLSLPLAETPGPVPAPSSPIPETVSPQEPPAPQTLRVRSGDGVAEMDIQDYLVGVVAAEMPASFPAEALKAQAVAARTYALYCAATGKHSDADVCTDYGCCQAWLDEDSLRSNWGEDFEKNLQAIRSAVEATAGESLRYQGQPVFAAFHSSSAGATEDCGAIWSPLPYLISVSSPESAADVPGYVSSLRCAPIDFRDVILSAFPEADFTGEPQDWLGEIRRDASGRVESAVLGGVSIPGTQLRTLFSLRSTAFTLEYQEGYWTFTVTGNGHGVGMSQYGAKVLADDGADYTQILAHYYPGTVLVKSS